MEVTRRSFIGHMAAAVATAAAASAGLSAIRHPEVFTLSYAVRFPGKNGELGDGNTRVYLMHDDGSQIEITSHVERIDGIDQISSENLRNAIGGKR